MGILRVKQRLNRMQVRQKIQRIVHLFTAKIKGVVFFVDRVIHRVLSGVLRGLYKIKIFRPFAKKAYSFVQAHHRFTSLAVVAVLMLSIAAPVLQLIAYNRQYALSTQARTLLGESNDNLSKKITYDEQARLYQFNKDAKKDPSTEGNPLAKLQSQVGGEGDKDAQQYSVDIPKNLSKGITYYDNQMGVSFKLIPEFTTKQGGLREGHLIYPLTKSKGQAAYTVLNNGLKENIILYESPGDTFKTSYYLDLPKSLEAKIIPETGEIGLYSADPALFGNISYGSSDDQARVENARNNGKKDYLTFKIPAPVVMGLNGNDQSTVAPVKSSFSLDSNTLTVTTTGLEKADYPLAIDPSVSIDSTSDFQTGNQEDKNSTIESGSIRQSALSGGTVDGWTNNSTNMPSGAYYHSSVAYNGYLYNVAGSSVTYAPISGDGSIGSWTSAASITGGGYNAGVAAYNGYLYVLGGGGSPTTDARYAKINGDGSISSWNPTTNLASGRTGHQAVAYNGYMYVIGGRDSSSATSPSTTTFNYTGTQQTYVVPAGVTSVKIGAQGADGGGIGYYSYDVGGSGAYAEADVPVTPGETLYVQVGGNGSTNNGYNGGGNSGDLSTGYFYKGGGASDVRRGGTALSDRKIIAGGGGGAGGSPGGSYGTYGAGGGDLSYFPPGGTSSSGLCGPGAGGTNTTGGAGGTIPAIGDTEQPGQPGALGVGGAGGDSIGGGGGGGYYGGGGGGGWRAYAGCGGGGGSSYVAPGATNVSVYGGSDGGAYYMDDGYVTITAQLPGPSNSVQYAPINADGTLGSWTSTTSFSGARLNHRSLAYNGYMYVLGGESTTQYNDVQYAPINADGTLGSWTSTTSFVTARSYHSAVVSRGHIYILGGTTSNLNDVQYARINTNGSLGGWNDTTAFNTGRYGHTSIAYNGFIYVIGGTGAAGVGDKIQYASISSPGATSNFKNSTLTSGSYFATLRQEHSSAVVGNYLYVIGGQNQTGAPAGYFKDVQYAPINADGSTGAWNTTASLPAENAHHELVVYNGRIYIVGGYNNPTLALNTIWYAEPAANGTIASWSPSNLPGKRYYHAATAYNGFMYVFGGTDGTTTFTNVYTAPINANGSLGGWFSNGNYVTSRSNHTAVAYNGYMYIAGGGSNTVQYALICTGYNSGVGGCSSLAGGLGTWATTAPLAASSGGLKMLAFDGYMYAFSFGNANTYRALINNDGTLNAWQAGPSLPGARGGAGVAIGNGTIYVTGGNNGSTSLYSTVLYAQINNGGGGGATGWVGGTNFLTARYNHAAVAYNGYLYVMGGFNSSTYYADVQKARILSNGGLDAWTSGGPDLPSVRSGIGAVAYNGYMYVLGGKNTGGYLNEVQRAAIDPSTGTLGSWTPDTNFSGARHATAAVTYNGYMYILGGNDAGPQTTMFYYTGSQQTYTVPAGVTKINVNAQGADGGDLTYVGGTAYGGSGSVADGDIPVTPGETLYIQVGGNGTDNNGYNGGGRGGSGDTWHGGYATHGGGATDVRRGGTGLGSRVFVAAGGGGAGGSQGMGSYYDGSGGGGGDAALAEPGEDSPVNVCTGGGGATNTAGGLGGTVQAIGDSEQPGTAGSLGLGGNGGDNSGGGGGGGYYGGGGGGGWRLYSGCGGGGGTSYIDPSGTTNFIYPGGTGYGYGQDGQVAITYGKPAYNDVQVAKINNDGTLGSWTSTTSMTQARTLHAAVAVNGYIYAVGGSNGVSGSTPYRTVEYAPINSDGTIGAWSQAAGMSSPRLNVSVSVVNGYMYAVGGYSGATFLNSVEYTPIHANGKLGGWQTTLSMGNIRSSEGKSVTSYNGRLYATGGFNGVSSAQNTTEYTGLHSIPRKFSYSKLIDLGTTSNITGISFTGNALVSRDNLNLKYKVGGANGVFGAYKSNGSFSCSEGDAGRYAQIFITLDDEKIATYRDEDSLRSILNSITIDSVPFAAPTEKRLRHGAFFQGQTLQPFNTNNTQCSV